jgi:hypothetical protein
VVRAAHPGTYRHSLFHPLGCALPGYGLRVGDRWHRFCCGVLAPDGRWATASSVPVCNPPACAGGCGDEHRHGAGHEYTMDGTSTVRSTAIGNTTDKMHKGSKDTAGAVQQGAEKRMPPCGPRTRAHTLSGTSSSAGSAGAVCVDGSGTPRGALCQPHEHPHHGREAIQQGKHPRHRDKEGGVPRGREAVRARPHAAVVTAGRPLRGAAISMLVHPDGSLGDATGG